MSMLRNGLVGICVGIAAAAAGVQAAQWTTYANERFGFSVEVPSDGFRQAPASENGDGQAWTSTADSGSIAAYGGFLVVTDSFQEYQSWLVAEARSNGYDVTYQASGAGWFVYSGKRKGEIIYERVLSTCAGDVTLAVRFDYPAASKNRWDPIVSHVAKSLRAGPADACP